MQSFSVTPRSRRDRGQHPSFGRLARTRGEDRDRLRRSAQHAIGRTEIHDRGRHTGTGGGNHVTWAGRQPPSRRCLQRPDLLKSLLGYWHNHPSLPLVSLLRPVHRPDQPASAHRRGAQPTPCTSWRSPSGRSSRDGRRRPGWSIASSATSWSTRQATRTAPSSASTSSSRPTARPAGAGSWSCAPSRCRRTGA